VRGSIPQAPGVQLALLTTDEQEGRSWQLSCLTSRDLGHLLSALAQGLIAGWDAQTGPCAHRVECKTSACGVIDTSSPSERRLTNE
jgi:hypothetical protein